MADRDRAQSGGGLAVSPRASALIVVDVQRYFVDDKSALGATWSRLAPAETARYFERVREIVIPSVDQLLKVARQVGVPVYYTAFGSLRDDGSDLVEWARQHNALSMKLVGAPMYPPASDPSWQIHDAVAPQPGEEVVPKTTSGPLNSTNLDETLRARSIDTVVVAGLATDVCVTQTAREFADRGFTAIVAEDACAASTRAAHTAALNTFSLVFGRVASTQAVIDAMTA